MGANQLQRNAWNGENGRRWVAEADGRDRVLQPVADALFDAARLQPGERVLDIGCGCGVTTMRAAELVGTGEVTGVDLSELMLEVARQRAGSTRIGYVEADAQTHPFAPDAYDVVISRFGTMFFDDPVAAFANIRVALVPGGRLCLATWQPLADNDWLKVPAAALVGYGALPDSNSTEPGMFGLSDPARIRQVLASAGWHDVVVEPATVALPLGATAQDAAAYLADTGIVRTVLEALTPDDRRAALSAVVAVLQERQTASGVELGAGIHLIQARC
ncbi:MAG TPA: methyltransferase domain-containing protein [Acidimicrobiales bacterium]|nr:methyltransferase domain-containing protein [Acidimicrobiales bacterium]